MTRAGSPATPVANGTPAAPDNSASPEAEATPESSRVFAGSGETLRPRSLWGEVADLRTLHDSPAHGLSVADLLRLDIVQRGRPEVLAGSNLASRDVRWVHTSEIYEISPLLKGGEVLLTTGLGLVGVGPAALTDYVHALADRSVAALVLELGRTFARPPQSMIDGAREFGLPLITMRGIVPFVEITETVHALLISREVARLRLGRHIDTVVNASLVAGAGLRGLLHDLAELAECPIQLCGNDGHIVAESAPPGAGTSQTIPDPYPASPLARLHFPEASVELPTHVWGRLVVCGPRTVARELIAERGAIAVAIELGRVNSGGGPSRHRAGALLLRDIFGRQYSSIDDVTGRAAALGLVIRPGASATGICLAIDTSGRARPRAAARAASRPTPQRSGGPATGALADAVEQILGPSLLTELDGSILIAASSSAADPRQILDSLADAVDSAVSAGRATAVVCGPPAEDIPALARSLRIAREASVLARRLHSDMRTLRYTDMGVHRLISRFASDPELAAFVDEQLGPLLDYDAVRGRELVRTLDTLLACGLSKSETARTLHIRRQTLYQRLETIENLLGGIDLTARERRTSLDLALVGWRLRTAGAGNVSTTGAARSPRTAEQTVIHNP